MEVLIVDLCFMRLQINGGKKGMEQLGNLTSGADTN